MVKVNQRRRTLRLVADGERLVSHAGLVVVDEVAQRLGVEAELTAAVGLAYRSQPPGRTLVRLAQMLIAGGDCVMHLRGLRDQPALFCEPTAHDSTAWRLLAERLEGAPLVGLGAARAAVRGRAWRAGLRPATVTIDIDAHLVTSHTDEKEAAFPTYKQGFGFHPLVAYLAETGEALAGILRPGCASALDAEDQLEVVDLALEQLPPGVSADEVVVRADTAGYAKEVVSGLCQRGVGFVVGAKLQGPIRDAIMAVAESDWRPITEADGSPREGAWLAEATWPAHHGWPADLRLIVRRERPHPGAQLTFSDCHGHRYIACLTNDLEADAAAIERSHRKHAIVEDRIREARQLGLKNLPFGGFIANHAWLQVVLLAQDLIAWTHRLARPTGSVWMEPRTLRFTLIAVAGRITHHARQRTLHLPRTWPWTPALMDAYQRAKQITIPAPM
jgi:Transposase DDE domain group 1